MTIFLPSHCPSLEAIIAESEWRGFVLSFRSRDLVHLGSGWLATKAAAGTVSSLQFPSSAPFSLVDSGEKRNLWLPRESPFHNQAQSISIEVRVCVPSSGLGNLTVKFEYAISSKRAKDTVFIVHLLQLERSEY